MRINLLISLLITVLSKNLADIYEAEKEILNKCILNSYELIEDMKEIYGDIQKAFINHHYLDILKKLGDYKQRNNKILFQCYHTLLEEEDDIVLEKGSSSGSSGSGFSRSGSSHSGSSHSGSSRSGSSHSGSSHSGSSHSGSSRSGSSHSGSSHSGSSRSGSSHSGSSRSGSSHSGSSRSSPTRSNPTRSIPIRSSPTRASPTRAPPARTPHIRTPSIRTPHIRTPSIKTPPIRTPPIRTPSIKTPTIKAPTKAPPIRTPPIKTPPIRTPPIRTPPIRTPTKTPPIKTQPIKTPTKTPQIKTPPIRTSPIRTQPIRTPPTRTPSTRTPSIRSPPTRTSPTNANVKGKDAQNNNKNNPLNSRSLQWANKIGNTLKPKDTFEKKIGKNGKAEFGVTSNSISVGGKYITHKGNQDTTYSGKIKAQKEDGKTSVSLTGGKMKTINQGPAYTKKGQEHEISGSHINDGKKKGYEFSYANRQITGNGYKVGKSENANTNIRERKFTGGVTKSNDGRIGAHGGIENTKTNTKSIKAGGKEISRSKYNTRSYSGEFGGKRTSQGYSIDGKLTRKDIRGTKYQIGKGSYTSEKEKGTVVKGERNIGKSEGNLRGSIENYDKTSHKIGYGDFKVEVSKKNYQKAEINTGFKTKNGVTTANAGASYATGREYNGKLGNMEVTGGKENKISARAGMRETKNGITANAQIQDSHRYSGSAKLGDISAQGSAGRTQAANVQATINKYGAGVKANYEKAFDANAHAKFGNTDINARGRFSDNTYGSASAQFKNGQLNAQGKFGKEYKAGVGLTLNGNRVANIDASAKGEAGAKLNVNKNGLSAGAGLNGQAKATAAFGKNELNVSVKSDFHVDAGFDLKSGLHFNTSGGLHVEAGVKNKNTGKQRNVKLFISQGETSYILYRKRKISRKKNMKKAKKNKILGQICRPSKHSF